MQGRSDRWVGIALAVLLHVALLAALTYGWWKYHRPTQTAPTLAIEATVVDARTVAGLTRPTPAPAPAPQPAPPAPQPQEASGPPPPTPEELARREQAQREAEQQAAAQKAQAEKQRVEEQQAQQRAAEEKAAQEKATQARHAEEKRKAEAEAEVQRQAEADLKRSLAAEQRVNSPASMSALASWRSQITAKITRAWLRPPTARAGLECNLYVTQVPGGEVTQVRVGECNGDQAVRESIEAAVYRASPLPPPPDPALFDRDLKITFKPDLD
jgi:colicin import membrane protein